MGERIGDYHEVSDWPIEKINSRLGELALNRKEMTPRQVAASEREVDCLIFEIHYRDEIDGRTDISTSA